MDDLNVFSQVQKNGGKSLYSCILHRINRSNVVIQVNTFDEIFFRVLSLLIRDDTYDVHEKIV